MLIPRSFYRIFRVKCRRYGIKFKSKASLELQPKLSNFSISSENPSALDTIQTLVGVSGTGTSTTANIPSSTLQLPHTSDGSAASINDNNSALERDDDMMSTISIDSTTVRYQVENGRTYHTYKAGTYLFPNDLKEQDRLDFQHHLFTLT